MPSQISLTTKIIIITLLFILISPWIWIFIRNYSYIIDAKGPFIWERKQIFIDEANTLRGELSESPLKPSQRLIINKPVIILYEITTRYLESWDPHYLFVQGDLDLRLSTRSNGPLLLSHLFFIIPGLWELIKYKKHRLLALFLLSITPVLSIFFFNHYLTLVKIPLLIYLAFLSAVGLVRLWAKHQLITKIIIFWSIFEFLRFLHEFYIHYPDKFVSFMFK